MPKYTYKCTKCNIEFEAIHSMSEELEDCSTCLAENSLQKVPQFGFIFKKKNKAGKIVTENISEAKRELEAMKQEMRKKI